MSDDRKTEMLSRHEMRVLAVIVLLALLAGVAIGMAQVRVAEMLLR